MSNTGNNQSSNFTSPMGKTGDFIQENKKSLIVIAATIVGLVVLFFAYQKFYLAPRETEAINQMYKAQAYWEQKDWDKAKNDTIGLQQFYENTKQNYKWKQRVDAEIFSATSQARST